MAFDAGAIVAKLRLDNKQFKGAIGASKKEVKGLSKSIRGMSTIMKGVFAASVVYATKKLVDFASQGAKLQDMEMAFDRLAQQSGTTSDAIVGDVRAITKALSRRKIVESANMLELLGVGMENTARLTEIARAAGVALGKDVGFMLESISTGTARQSRLWLDNLGIIISIEDANKDYAKTLGKLSSALTDTEKRAAFLYAVLNKGGDIIDAVGSDSELASEKVGSFTASLSNLWDEILKLVSTGGAGTLASLVSGIDKVTVAIGRLALLKNAKSPLEFSQNLNYLFGHTDPSVVGKDLGTIRGLPARAFDMPSSGGGFVGPTRGGVSGGDAMAPSRNAATAGAQQAARAAVAAQQAAQSYFNAMLARTQAAGNASGTFGPQNQQANPYGYIDTAEIPIPDLIQSTDKLGENFINLSSLAGGFFETLVTGAVSGAEGMTKILGGAIGGIATMIGRMLIAAGVGIKALGQLNPWAAIAAGVSLLAIGAAIRGAMSRGSAANVHTPSPAAPRANEAEAGPGVVIHVEGDFMGDDYWIDKFTRRVNSTLRRNGRVEVFA